MPSAQSIFLDMQSGIRTGSSELSMINTALLIPDVLTPRIYFNAETTGEAELREIADQTVSACL
jgi:hypothetical protein